MWEEEEEEEQGDEEACANDEVEKAARLVLIVAGTDAEGLMLAARLAQPTIPPMTRAPFTNQVPDFVVVGRDAWAQGPGGVLAAGFWGNQWEYMEESAYSQCV